MKQKAYKVLENINSKGTLKTPCIEFPTTLLSVLVRDGLITIAGENYAATCTITDAGIEKLKELKNDAKKQPAAA